MDLEKLNKFKKMAIISLFADDALADLFVLKGGTALDLIYKINKRSSMDIDVSLKNEFTDDQLDEIQNRLRESFEMTFEQQEYHIIDFQLYKRPFHPDRELDRDWGGYRIEFKIASDNIYQKNNGNLKNIRVQSEVVNEKEGRKFQIDISKFECVDGKQATDIDGYTVYVYTPKMIIYEKIRAICQQFPGYYINKGHFKKARPRDFYDIYSIISSENTDLTFEELDYNTLKAFFDKKKVPMELIEKIPEYYDDFYDGLASLTETLTEEAKKDFDFRKCFDFVIDGIKKIPRS